MFESLEAAEVKWVLSKLSMGSEITHPIQELQMKNATPHGQKLNVILA